jgi:hypothetical protein
VGWYKLITWPERWSNAQKVCKLEMAHLAVPDTRQKVRVFLQIFKNYPDVLEQAILHRQVYVGVHSSGQDRNFSTVLGKFTGSFAIDHFMWATRAFVLHRVSLITRMRVLQNKMLNRIAMFEVFTGRNSEYFRLLRSDAL